MPPAVTSVSLIICRRVEPNERGILSAIEIADVYTTDEEDPINVAALLLIKTEPNADPSIEHSLEVQMVKPDGSIHRFTTGGQTTIRYFSNIKNPEVYGGVTAIIALPLRDAPLGLYMVRAFIDGEEVSRAPIMLLPSVSE